MKHDHAEAIYEGVHLFGVPAWNEDAGKGLNGPTVIGNFFTPEYYASWMVKPTLFS
jgi:hypothetical protein